MIVVEIEIEIAKQGKLNLQKDNFWEVLKYEKITYRNDWRSISTRRMWRRKRRA